MSPRKNSTRCSVRGQFCEAPDTEASFRCDICTERVCGSCSLRLTGETILCFTCAIARDYADEVRQKQDAQAGDIRMAEKSPWRGLKR